MPHSLISQVEAMKKISIESFKSNYVVPRQIDVYLPPGYPGAGNYRVLYMHDGQNLSNPATSTFNTPWRADETLSRLMRDGKIPPTILVGIWSTSERYQEYAPSPAFANLSEKTKFAIRQNYGEIPYGEAYLRFLVEELKPFIDKEYKTIQGPSATSIAGSSMGGLSSLYALCSYPEVFSRAACLSIHWPILTKVPDDSMFNSFIAWVKLNLPADENHRLYMDRGTATLDSLYKPYMDRVELIVGESGFPSECYQIKAFEGAEHNENAWANRFEEVLIFLLGEH
ncbi:MAG: alpha/beta hydrolase [Bacteroidetes bacterium]|nr:alpha/beta hydrolase [Bacteroidota bacterium]